MHILYLNLGQIEKNALDYSENVYTYTMKYYQLIPIDTVKWKK